MWVRGGCFTIHRRYSQYTRRTWCRLYVCRSLQYRLSTASILKVCRRQGSGPLIGCDTDGKSGWIARRRGGLILPIFDRTRVNPPCGFDQSEELPVVKLTMKFLCTRFGRKSPGITVFALTVTCLEHSWHAVPLQQTHVFGWLNHPSVMPVVGNRIKTAPRTSIAGRDRNVKSGRRSSHAATLQNYTVDWFSPYVQGCIRWTRKMFVCI